MILAAIICDPDRFSADVQRDAVERVTGRRDDSGAYHAAFYDTDTAMFYDMNWKWRKVNSEHYQNRRVKFYRVNTPRPLTREYCESMIGKRRYGVLDVSLFDFAKALGIDLPGSHCSEAINDDFWIHGEWTDWHINDAPPAPLELDWWLADHHLLVEDLMPGWVPSDIRV